MAKIKGKESRESAKSFGGILRALREQSGLGNLKEAGSRLGVSGNTLGAYERGEILPDVDFLALFATETGESFPRLLALRLSSGKNAASEALGAQLLSDQHGAEEFSAKVIAGLTQQQLNVLDEFRRYVERAVCDHGSDSSVAELADEFERQYNTGSGALRGEGIIAVSGVERVSAPALLESLKAIDSLNAGYRVPVLLASRLDVNRFHFRPVLFRDVTKALGELGHEVNETEDLDVVAHALIVAASRGETKLARVPRELISKLLELLVFLRR